MGVGASERERVEIRSKEANRGELTIWPPQVNELEIRVARSGLASRAITREILTLFEPLYPPHCRVVAPCVPPQRYPNIIHARGLHHYSSPTRRSAGPKYKITNELKRYALGGNFLH
jgi:hypothetical protein